MELIYRTNFLVNTSQADAWGRLRPSCLLAQMQEAAGMHSSRLGAGWGELTPRGLFWAVIRQKVEFDRIPTIGETVTLETWPGPATRTAYPRYTRGLDEKGNVLFQGAALWLIMDRESRAMILPGKNGVEVPGLLRQNELALPRNLPPVPGENSLVRRVRYSELDVNGHMSNTRYLDWMEDLLPGEFHRQRPLRAFQISYLSEALEGQELTLGWALSPEGELHLEASRPDGRVFAIRAQY